jgi:hypothetical protein
MNGFEPMGNITPRLLIFLLILTVAFVFFGKSPRNKAGGLILTELSAEEEENEPIESSTWSGKVTVTLSDSSERVYNERHEKTVTGSNATFSVRRLPFVSKEVCSSCEADWEGIVNFTASFDQQYTWVYPPQVDGKRCSGSVVTRGNGTGEAHLGLSCRDGDLVIGVGSVSNYLDPKTGKEREVIAEYKVPAHTKDSCRGESNSVDTISPPPVRIETEHCDLKKGRISGTKTIREGASVTTLTWDLALDSPDLEAVIIPPKDYNWWIPEAGRDENTAGNSLEVTVKVQSKNEKKPSKQKAKLTFELVDVSKEPGICMNWPRNGKDDFDLRIDDSDEELDVPLDKKGQWAQTKEYQKEFRIFVKSYDYGAYGKLKVKAETKDGRPISVRVEGQPSQDELMIPLDNNNNHVADKYERDFYIPGNKAADSDEDFVPEGDKNRGDGLTLYEEYRGFMTKNSKHVRSDPAKKTLFVHNRVPHAEAGIDLFRTQSRIEVFELDKEEQMNPSRVINYNYHFAHKTDQHGVKMVEFQFITGDTGNKKVGTAGDTPLGPPKKVDEIRIQQDYEKYYYGSRTDAIAHELGHAVRMDHHGEGDYLCGERIGCMKYFEELERACGDNERCKRQYKDKENFYIAVMHGETSGDETCIMRYDTAQYYEKTDTWPTTFVPYGRIVGTRTRFCSYPKDQGDNGPSNPKTGYATKGDCMGQICVSDKYY